MKRFSSMLLVAALMSASGSSAGADASIEQAFDRSKGGLYAIYGRALREDPKLKGKMVFEISVGTTGEVTRCHVKSSELGPDLAAKMCARIELIRFPAREAPTTFLKPIDFYPA